MVKYSSKSGKGSGVTGFKISKDSITVEFNHTEYYTYSYKSAGRLAVAMMKRLALSSRGLSTYISREKPAYERMYSVR
jgi:hypothetical protein